MPDTYYSSPSCYTLSTSPQGPASSVLGVFFFALGAGVLQDKSCGIAVSTRSSLRASRYLRSCPTSLRQGEGATLRDLRDGGNSDGSELGLYPDCIRFRRQMLMRIRRKGTQNTLLEGIAEVEEQVLDTLWQSKTPSSKSAR